jgi:hypothetical protein
MENLAPRSIEERAFLQMVLSSVVLAPFHLKQELCFLLFPPRGMRNDDDSAGRRGVNDSTHKRCFDSRQVDSLLY